MDKHDFIYEENALACVITHIVTHVLINIEKRTQICDLDMPNIALPLFIWSVKLLIHNKSKLYNYPLIIANILS